MRFDADQKGIINRYLREGDGWNKHLEATKSFIINEARNKVKGTAVILGSGWWLDVPVEELASMFKKLVLVDISHPPQIRHKSKKHKNISLITTDITGGAAKSTYYFIRKYNNSHKLSLNDIDFDSTGFGINPPIKADFVASVNILNQLDILIVDFLKKNNHFSDIELNQFRKKIQQQHLDALPAQKSCLITDYEEIIIKPSTNEIEETKPLLHVSLSDTIKESWQWDFDTKQTYNAGKITLFNVFAVTI